MNSSTTLLTSRSAVRPVAALDRDGLRRRQAEVLGTLLAGRVPAGFDGPGAAMTHRVLAVKRAASAARACPELASLPTWPSGFVHFAAGHPKQGCSAHDARAYIDWLRTSGTPAERRWVAAATVRCGARRWVVVDGRLVVRIAGRTFGT